MDAEVNAFSALAIAVFHNIDAIQMHNDPSNIHVVRVNSFYQQCFQTSINVMLSHGIPDFLFDYFSALS